MRTPWSGLSRGARCWVVLLMLPSVVYISLLCMLTALAWVAWELWDSRVGDVARVVHRGLALPLEWLVGVKRRI